MRKIVFVVLWFLVFVSGILSVQAQAGCIYNSVKMNIRTEKSTDAEIVGILLPGMKAFQEFIPADANNALGWYKIENGYIAAIDGVTVADCTQFTVDAESQLPNQQAPQTYGRLYEVGSSPYLSASQIMAIWNTLSGGIDCQNLIVVFVPKSVVNQMDKHLYETYPNWGPYPNRVISGFHWPYGELGDLAEFFTPPTLTDLGCGTSFVVVSDDVSQKTQVQIIVHEFSHGLKADHGEGGDAVNNAYINGWIGEYAASNACGNINWEWIKENSGNDISEEQKTFLTQRCKALAGVLN